MSTSGHRRRNLTVPGRCRAHGTALAQAPNPRASTVRAMATSWREPLGILARFEGARLTQPRNLVEYLLGLERRYLLLRLNDILQRLRNIPTQRRQGATHSCDQGRKVAAVRGFLIVRLITREHLAPTVA